MNCPALRSRSWRRHTEKLCRQVWRYNKTFGARGAERASTRYIGNAVERSQIPRNKYSNATRNLWV